MVYFQTKNTNLGKFWRIWQWKMSVNFVAIWSILWPFVIFYGYLVWFFSFWYVAPRKIWQPCKAFHYIFDFKIDSNQKIFIDIKASPNQGKCTANGCSCFFT
jgi:hypothetical protein